MVQKDKVGLFVTIGPWACRPLEASPFSQGDQVTVEQLQSVTVGLRAADAQEGSPVGDVWLRCGFYEEHRHDQEKRRQENFEFFKMFTGQVQAQKAAIAQGLDPAPAGAEQHALVMPRVAQARKAP